MLNRLVRDNNYADSNCITIHENTSKIALNATSRKNLNKIGLHYNVCITLFLCLCVSGGS